METITVRSKIDAKVFWDFSNFTSYRMTKRHLVLLVGFPVFMLVMGALSLAGGGGALGGGFVLVGIAYPVSYLVYYRSTIRKEIKRFGLETAQNFYTVTLSDSGVHVENKSEAVDVPWAKMWRAYRLEHYFYVFATRQRGFILPVCDIENATAEDLAGMLHSRMTQGAYFDLRKLK